MIRSNLRFKLLGLSAMLLGLMAFSASSAQGAAWMVGANNVTSTLLPNIQVTEIEKLELLPTDQGKHLVLLTKIGGAEVKILCTGASLVSVQLRLSGALSEGGKASFTGCETFLNGTLSAVCQPSSAGQPGGTVVSEEGKGQLLESGLTQIKPKSGTNFAVLKFGEECSLPESVPVIGSLFIKDCVNVENSSAKHLIEADNVASKLYVISETEEHKTQLHGSVIVELTGTDAGSAWSGLPKG